MLYNNLEDEQEGIIDSMMPQFDIISCLQLYSLI